MVVHQDHHNIDIFFSFQTFLQCIDDKKIQQQQQHLPLYEKSEVLGPFHYRTISYSSYVSCSNRVSDNTSLNSNSRVTSLLWTYWQKCSKNVAEHENSLSYIDFTSKSQFIRLKFWGKKFKDPPKSIPNISICASAIMTTINASTIVFNY